MAHEHEVGRLYTQYAERLRRYLLLKSSQPELAADLTHECFSRLLAIPVAERPDNVLPYLFTMANNLLIDYRRNHNQSRTESVAGQDLHLILDSSPGPDVLVQAQQRMERLGQAMAALPLRSRQVFQLCRLEGMSYQQAASHLAISVSSVQKHLSKAIEVLGLQLRDDD